VARIYVGSHLPFEQSGGDRAHRRQPDRYRPGCEQPDGHSPNRQ
jgi:hypothetical protein